MGDKIKSWTDDPSTPAWRPPAGAVDAHVHVFGPEARFPF
ncbi:MAG TPA: 2-pyrone-4,6-dicarboxylate hydrolase, partial [Sphingopyxis sp.]|nr:2-pyrone-4,6-dicarboxylate hydrolase [Sphingopyxis sp.]